MEELRLASSTVLVVDDVRFNRDIVRQLLGGLGKPIIVEAADGNEALKALAEGTQPIDFVISDFDMPVCHGLQLLKAVRTGRHGRGRGIPFAMLTAYSDVHLVKAALALDVNTFLIRPVSKAKLAEGFERMIARRGSHTWVKPVAEYEAIDVSPARIAEWRILPTQSSRLKALDAILPDSPLARKVSAAISDLANASGDNVAARILSTLDAFIGRGALGLDDLPKVIGALAETQRVGGGRSGAKIETTTDGARLAKALQEIRDGAPLVTDMHTADGKLFIEAGTELTPQILNIVINLDDLGLLQNVEESLAKAAASPVPARQTGPATQCSVEDLAAGMVVARDLKTADGRKFFMQGATLDDKAINQINIAHEVGQIGATVWVFR